jgi:hypothetical protein
MKRMKILTKLRKVLFPRRFAQRQQEKEQELRQARWGKLAEEEYQVWQQGGKEAWQAWRKEQAEKRREEERNLIEPAWMKELRKGAITHPEVRYPPLSPEQRRVEREWQQGGKDGLRKVYQRVTEK